MAQRRNISPMLLLLGTTVLTGCGLGTPKPRASSGTGPSVVTSALNWIAHHKAFLDGMRGPAALQGPMRLAGSGPYSATIQLQPIINAYSIDIWETKIPMGINQVNPPVVNLQSHVIHHSTTLRAPSPIATWEVGWSLPLASQRPTPTLAYAESFIKPLGKGYPVTLPQGVSGMQYDHGTDPAGTAGNTVGPVSLVLWHRSQWTFEAVGASARSLAHTMVDLIHVARLPKTQSGILVVDQSPQNPNQLSTSLAWYQAPGYSIGFWSIPSTSNLQDTLTMAASWRGLSKLP